MNRNFYLFLHIFYVALSFLNIFFLWLDNTNGPHIDVYAINSLLNFFTLSLIIYNCIFYKNPVLNFLFIYAISSYCQLLLYGYYHKYYDIYTNSITGRVNMIQSIVLYLGWSNLAITPFISNNKYSNVEIDIYKILREKCNIDSYIEESIEDSLI